MFYKLSNLSFLISIGTEATGRRCFLNSVAAAHGHGYRENERQEWRKVIFQTIFQEIQALCRSMEDFGISYEDQTNTVRFFFFFYFIIIYNANCCFLIFMRYVQVKQKIKKNLKSKIQRNKSLNKH